jgi:hypothetical protein
MATPIIAAIRQRRDLKESLLHTAQELAHLASVYGVVKVSYSYLAIKCRCSRRTVIRHIQRLLDLRLIRRDRLRRLGQQFFEINTYTFQIAWDTSRPKGGSDKTSRNLPPQEREKNTSLREELANQKKWFPNLLPGSNAWASTRERIARLEQLLAPGALPAVA